MTHFYSCTSYNLLGGMSDRGYSSMSLEDAKKLSTAVGSQDSLDIESRPSIVKSERKNSAKRGLRSRMEKPNDIQQIDPKVEEQFQKRINSIMRKTGDITENGSKGSPCEYSKLTGQVQISLISGLKKNIFYIVSLSSSFFKSHSEHNISKFSLSLL